jgi:hypothetical protein
MFCRFIHRRSYHTICKGIWGSRLLIRNTTHKILISIKYIGFRTDQRPKKITSPLIPEHLLGRIVFNGASCTTYKWYDTSSTSGTILSHCTLLFLFNTHRPVNPMTRLKSLNIYSHMIYFILKKLWLIIHNKIPWFGVYLLVWIGLDVWVSEAVILVSVHNFLWNTWQINSSSFWVADLISLFFFLR